MRTLEKISAREANVLSAGQMYSCFGGKDTTSGTRREKRGEVMYTVTVTDTYDDKGTLISKCSHYESDY